MRKRTFSCMLRYGMMKNNGMSMRNCSKTAVCRCTNCSKSNDMTMHKLQQKLLYVDAQIAVKQLYDNAQIAAM